MSLLWNVQGICLYNTQLQYHFCIDPNGVLNANGQTTHHSNVVYPIPLLYVLKTNRPTKHNHHQPIQLRFKYVLNTNEQTTHCYNAAYPIPLLYVLKTNRPTKHNYHLLILSHPYGVLSPNRQTTLDENTRKNT